MKGRKPHTGDFETREELVREVLKLYHQDLETVHERRMHGENYRGLSIGDIAKMCGVSEGVAGNIINNKR